MEFAKVTRGNKKSKKNQVKNELDRMKLAEKKKRRLEKAVAASKAICAELEKKKMKKKEEQEKLYEEEGASIAEAVALHVLLGEDSDDSSQVMLEKDYGLTSWDHANNTNIMIEPQYSYYDLSKFAYENIENFAGAREYGRVWSNYDTMASSGYLGRGFYQQYVGDNAGCCPIGLSIDHVAARAFSSLEIGDNDTGMPDSLVYNSVLRQ